MTENSMTASPFVAYVGIDWAEKVHAVCELSQDGERIHASEVEQSPEAISERLKRMRAICGQGAIAIGLELSRGGLVAALLQHEGLVLFPVNPKQLSRYRDAMIPSGAKNDPGDGRLLAEFVRDHHSRLRPWIPDDAATRTISLCCELRRKLVDEKKRLIQRLKSLLKAYYPQALDILGDSLATKLAQDFLIRWPGRPADDTL